MPGTDCERCAACSETEVADDVEAEAQVAGAEAGGGVAAQHLVDGRGARVAEDDLEDVAAHRLREGGVPGGAAACEVAVPGDVFELEERAAEAGKAEAEGDVEGVLQARRVGDPGGGGE